MPRYSLRTLMIVMMLGGPLCAWGWVWGQRQWERMNGYPNVQWKDAGGGASSVMERSRIQRAIQTFNENAKDD